MTGDGDHPDRPRGNVRRVFDTRVRGRARTATAVLRVVTGAVFVLFSLPKFLLHQVELAEFVRFGFPESSLIVYLVGLLELGGGLMLVLGLGTRLAALGLGLDMVGAVATAGIQVGGPVHLGLAPALLLAALYLLWAGPGAAALDHRFATGTGAGRLTT